MSEINISFEEAKQFPNLIQEIEDKIRKSKSKYRNDELNTFKWNIRYWEKVVQLSEDIEERITQILDNCAGELLASKGKGHWSSNSLLEDKSLIEKEIRQQVLAIQVEQEPIIDNIEKIFPKNKKSLTFNNKSKNGIISTKNLK